MYKIDLKRSRNAGMKSPKSINYRGFQRVLLIVCYYTSVGKKSTRRYLNRVRTIVQLKTLIMKYKFILCFMICTIASQITFAQWTNINIPSGWSLDKASFVDDFHGYAASSNYNYLFRTTNGGATWDSVIVPQGVVDLDFISIDTGFVLINIFSSFSIATTFDGGDNWITDTMPSGTYFQLIRFTDAVTGYATSNFGSVYKTTNGGNNWTPITLSGYSSASDKEYTGKDTIIFTGWDGTFGYQGSVISSVNSGGSFQEHIIPTLYSQLTGTHFRNGINGFGVFTMSWPQVKNYLINTTNGGIGWDTILTDTNSTRMFQDVFMNSPTFGFIATTTNTNGTILKVNGGTTTLDHTTNKPLRRLFKGGNTLFAIGDGGTVIKTGLPLGIEPTITPLEGIYPNPTTDQLFIPVDIKSEISIFDMTGKVVQSGIFIPGEAVSLGSLSNGMYVVRVSNENGISSGTVIVNR